MIGRRCMARCTVFGEIGLRLRSHGARERSLSRARRGVLQGVPRGAVTILLLSLRTVRSRSRLLARRATLTVEMPPTQRVFFELDAFGGRARPLRMWEIMMKQRCPHCHRPGLIRSEHIIKGEDSATFFFCGGCSFSWEEPDVVSAIVASAERDRPARRSTR